MRNKSVFKQINILFGIILANFIAKIPYFFQLYYHRLSDLRRMINLPMGVVFVLFITSYILLVKRNRVGYWLMIIFLSIEFIFYLSNSIGEVAQGFGLFFHLGNPNLVLRAVFAIGYLNLFVSGYFLFLLIYKRSIFLKS